MSTNKSYGRGWSVKECCEKLGNKAKLHHLQTTNNKISITQLFNNDKIFNYAVNDPVQANKITDQYIDFLIVSVKTFDTVSALTPLLSKINNQTKILLVQNGMGVIDQLYSEVWPQLKQRPELFQGVISHGVFQDSEKTNTFDYNHAGFGNLKICKLPRELNSGSDSIVNDGLVDDEIIELLAKSEDLDCQFLPYCDLLVYQVEKFMVNCCINSITSILDCVNGELHDIESCYDLFRNVIEEALEILLKNYPVLQDSKLTKKILQVDTLLEYTIDCGTLINGKNSSSMRQDTLHLRNVEIDYINGYVASLAEKMGLKADVNKTITLLVKTRLQINRNRAK
ncbi:unnamed protein product [Ambrosiozyma monospora]|uniref:2-dehydropantoate 2-reductase n=1 Tax=Ambrosiozyma monospora TaxID=43982 RepID=A0A9W6YTB1_AMBMO|nr:unnamed protein product [Ambrosiozyma monospora]